MRVNGTVVVRVGLCLGSDWDLESEWYRGGLSGFGVQVGLGEGRVCGNIHVKELCNTS